MPTHSRGSRRTAGERPGALGSHDWSGWAGSATDSGGFASDVQEKRYASICPRAWSIHERIGRFLFVSWRKNAGSRTMSKRPSRGWSTSKKCWRGAQSGENGVWLTTVRILFHSSLQSRKIFVCGRRMHASDAFWRFTAFRFRNWRQRVRLQPKPRNLRHRSIRRSGPERESRYFEAWFAGGKMSTLADRLHDNKRFVQVYDYVDN